MRDLLVNLFEALQRNGESVAAERVKAALEGTDSDVHAFLLSNELWGGAGSIADQAGVNCKRMARREIESVLIRLGNEQIRAGKVNVRTAMWVSAFEEWAAHGI